MNLSLLITGELPADAHPGARNACGLYRRQGHLVNGKPAFMKDGQLLSSTGEAMAMWFHDDGNGQKSWLVGKHTNLGNDDAYLELRCSDDEPAQTDCIEWLAANLDDETWMAAPQLRHYAIVKPGGVEPDVVVVEERTRKQRDAEGRKRAIDVDSADSRKRARSALDLRVAKARSLRASVVDARYKALLQPSVNDWADDKIDDVVLSKRKATAREAANSEDAPLRALESAYAGFTAAIERSRQAVDAARLAVQQAEHAEDAAEVTLETALRAIEPEAEAAVAGPSGAVKREGAAG
ncbi:hypothetical protein EMIHUDRAFT_113963 [Emiliania huxleyi CCMP1516]|uniref:Uncharacterized protein n=2 Tax=Emiliania huxleyi TaxID=2903 RepID=A0A0D3JZR3_EMIH1|nr:hypothetical protein EMIHUDRAFT_113963 [Emiliania huxleyi CCMP1516]EOD28998.1 hypothetical protein EMIHUDRAFT_113963 [Emiliania huxleyi CCMP1516]|eukprot:XP_005781427.1 hypothetical protein EMIHUDRAFT_113963 [Emiliania huxleyi CCMP1516]